MYEYPFGNDQRLNLDWFLAEWKNLLAAWEAEKNGIDGALDAEIARAEAALSDVFAARDAAAQSAANALESKNAAAQSASDASGYLATVRADANAAQDAARNAAQSESNAADSAQTAVASKNAAGQSERNAAQSEANALASKDAAAQSASDADASKDAAAQSASDAENAAASVEASAQQIATNTADIVNLKQSFILMPLEYLTKKIFGDASFSFSRYSRKVERIGNRFITTHQSGGIGDATRYNINLFGEFRVVSGTSLEPLETEFIPINEIGTQIGCVLYRDYNEQASSPDGIRIVLADDNNNVLFNSVATRSTDYTALLINLKNYIEQNPTATKIALYYYSADASTHEAIIGIYPLI